MKRLHSIGVRLSETKPEIENGDDDHCGEFVEQPAENAAHEEHGNEDGGERQRHGQNGEGDFAAAIERRHQSRLAHFHVAHDVFEHHDGVVDHKSDGERQRHQR